jgi:6,7-dimethyl-8-ribityllumazine synthase
VLVVVSRYNHSVTSRLLDGARAEYARAGGDPSRLAIAEAPGAYELPALALAGASSGSWAGVVALGCLIRGDTRHDRYIADAVAHGLMTVSLVTGVPVALGVLTTENPAQARARAGGSKGNKGAEAMAALLDSIHVAASLRSGRSPAAEHSPRARTDKAAPRRGRHA